MPSYYFYFWLFQMGEEGGSDYANHDKKLCTVVMGGVIEFC